MDHINSGRPHQPMNRLFTISLKYNIFLFHIPTIFKSSDKERCSFGGALGLIACTGLVLSHMMLLLGSCILEGTSRRAEEKVYCIGSEALPT